MKKINIVGVSIVLLCSYTLFLGSCKTVYETEITSNPSENFSENSSELIMKVEAALDVFYANDSWKTITEWKSHGTRASKCVFSYHRFNGDTITKTENANSVPNSKPIYGYNNQEVSYSSWSGYAYNTTFMGTLEEYMQSRNTFRRKEIVMPQAVSQNDDNSIVFEYTTKFDANKVYFGYCAWPGYGQPKQITQLKETIFLSEADELTKIIFKYTYELTGYKGNIETFESDVSFQFFPNTGRIDIPIEAQHLFGDYCS